MTDILKILKGYRTRYSFNDGDSLELVDMLCPDDADDITDGLLELEALAEYLYDELPDHADLTAKLKLAVEALEAIRDASTWAKSWDHPSHLNDKARVALAKIGEQR